MRLIDADDFKKFMQALCKAGSPYESFIELLDKQTIAYDIDKVVEELESFAKLAEDRWTNGTSKHAYQEHKCWVKAIEIVKHGGVSDDVCGKKIKVVEQMDEEEFCYCHNDDTDEYHDCLDYMECEECPYYYADLDQESD